MRTSSILVAAALLFGGASVSPQVVSVVGATRPPAGSPLDTIAWVVGRWATTEPGGKGDSIRVVMDCQWSATRNAILFSVTTAPSSTGKTSPYYDGAYFPDPEHNALGSWQVDNHGNVGQATVVIT